MKLHAPTAGTPVLQHRPEFSSFKFTPQYRCSSCNIDETSCSHCGHTRLATQTRVLLIQVHTAISVLILQHKMELHAPTAGTPVLQHRPGFSSFKVHIAISMLILQHRWNFTLPLRAYSSCNTNQDSSHSYSTPQYGQISCNTDGISRSRCESHSSRNIDQDSFHSISPSQYRHIYTLHIHLVTQI